MSDTNSTANPKQNVQKADFGGPGIFCTGLARSWDLVQPAAANLIPSFCSRCRLIWSPERKELPLTALLEASVPFFSESALAVYCVGLAENGGLPKPDICLWKVAKTLHFLATFWVHPWTFMIHHEPMLATTE